MTTVLIWNNKMYGSNDYPGHAALSIDDQWTRAEQAVSYVSWWPDDKKKKIGKGNVADPSLSFSMDLQLEGYAPDHIIKIDNLWIGTMLNRWKTIRGNPNNRYRFLRSNCSTIAGQVLTATKGRGSAMTRNNLIWTPLKVMRLALSMGGREMGWTEFLNETKQAGYLTASDVVVLSNLYRRDERHGAKASGNAYYYSGGRSVNPKAYLMWKGFTAGTAQVGGAFFRSEEGSILSVGLIRANNEDPNKGDMTQLQSKRIN